VRVGAGNENERRHLIPLVDELLTQDCVPAELWADRGYDGAELRRQVLRRGIEPLISRRRRAGEAVAPGTPRVRRANRLRPRPRDPSARHRWPVERTTSWLRAWRRVDTRWERLPELWLAVVQVAAAITLYRMLECSFR
jgi:hypothetical protein